MLDRFEAGFNRLTLVLASCVALSIGFFAVSIPLDLLIRSLQWGNLPWLYEGIEYLLYMGVFLGAPRVLQQRGHVRVDIVITLLPPPVAARLEQALDAAGAIICGLLCYYGVRVTISDYIEDSLPDRLFALPDWWMMAVFSIACLMLVIEFLLRLRRASGVVSEETTATSESGF